MVARSARRRAASLRRVRVAGWRTARSPLLSGLARAGLVARGVMYVLIGVIAVEIAIGSRGRQADTAGAVRVVAATPAGSVLLWLLAIGFSGLTLWLLCEAAWCAAGPDGHRPVWRLASLGRALGYGAATYSVLRYALGVGAPPSSDTQSRDLTATALRHGGGQAVVAIAGAAFMCGGVVLAYQAATRKFRRQLRMAAAPAPARRAVDVLGQTGGVARGAVFCAVGVFLITAALTRQPAQARGIDSVLRSFARTPLGPWLLVIVALGLVAFGCYSFGEARWRAV